MFPSGNEEIMELLDSKKRKDNKVQERIAELEQRNAELESRTLVKTHCEELGQIGYLKNKLAERDALIREGILLFESSAQHPFVFDDVNAWIAHAKGVK